MAGMIRITFILRKGGANLLLSNWVNPKDEWSIHIYLMRI